MTVNVTVPPSTVAVRRSPAATPVKVRALATTMAGPLSANDPAAVALLLAHRAMSGGREKVIYVQSNIEADVAPFLFKTIGAACLHVRKLRLNQSGPFDFTRCTLICSGYFDEQVILPFDTSVRGQAMGQFSWTYTGNRAGGNYVVKPTYKNWLTDCQLWGTFAETDVAILCDDETKDFHMLNVHGLSRMPEGGDALSHGFGRSKFLRAIGAVWPKTILGWNVLVNAQGVFGPGQSAIDLINTDATNGNKPADVRFWNLNVDCLYSVSGACIHVENLWDVHLLGPQLLGNVSSLSDKLVEVVRTILTGAGRSTVNFYGGTGSGFTGSNHASSGTMLAFDASAGESAPVKLFGDAIATFQYATGGTIYRRSPDLFSSRVVPVAPSSTSVGGVTFQAPAPAGAQGPIGWYACQPGYVGQFNVIADLRNRNTVVDDFYFYGLAVRNPTTRQVYVFGVRAGIVLHLSLWNQPVAEAPLALVTPDVVPQRVYQDVPVFLGAFRDPSGAITFELRNSDNLPVSVMHTLPANTPNLAGFTEVGVAFGNQNAAGAGVDVNFVVNSFIGLP